MPENDKMDNYPRLENLSRPSFNLTLNNSLVPKALPVSFNDGGISDKLASLAQSFNPTIPTKFSVSSPSSPSVATLTGSRSATTSVNGIDLNLGITDLAHSGMLVQSLEGLLQDLLRALFGNGRIGRKLLKAYSNGNFDTTNLGTWSMRRLGNVMGNVKLQPKQDTPATSVQTGPVEEEIADNYAFKGFTGTDWGGGKNQAFLNTLGNQFIQDHIDTNGDGNVDLQELLNFQGTLGSGNMFSDGKLGWRAGQAIMNMYGNDAKYGFSNSAAVRGLGVKPISVTPPVQEQTPPPIQGQNDYVKVNGEDVYAHNPYRNAEAYNAAHPGGGKPTPVEQTPTFKMSSGNSYLNELRMQSAFDKEFFDYLKKSGQRVVTNYLGGADTDWLRKHSDYNKYYNQFKKSNSIKGIWDTITDAFSSSTSLGNINNYGTTNHVLRYNSRKLGGKLIKKYK